MCLLAITVLSAEGRAIGFCLSGCLVIFYGNVLCGAYAAVFVVSTVFNVTADRLHVRFVRHSFTLLFVKLDESIRM